MNKPRLHWFGLWALACAALVVLVIAVLPARAMDGREVYDRMHDLRLKTLDRKTEFTMTLVDRGGGTRTRTATEYSKKSGPEGYKVLVVFKAPPDLADVGFLIHARSFAERDLWAYFPEFKKIRRIPTTSQDDSFFGSDFSYDDFGGPPHLDDYGFTLQGEEMQDGRACYLVEVKPKIRRKWTRCLAWVDKEFFVHRKIVYYRDKEAYRAGTFADIRLVDGLPTAFRMEMGHLGTGHRTEVRLETITYHTRHPDELFSQGSLERAGR